MITSIQRSHIYRFEFLKYALEQFNRPEIPIRQFSIFNILTHRFLKPINSFNGDLQIRHANSPLHVPKQSSRTLHVSCCSAAGPSRPVCPCAVLNRDPGVPESRSYRLNFGCVVVPNENETYKRAARDKSPDTHFHETAP
ncbi:hypothetical protein [Burkholderia ubonensis]|uniref:hypothetical protein n=1 Tax=Burkholderia ubonensis TaxID=101571 RepID=UPI0012FC48AD|nr:hypothetical protein [Burkholderia ubonensis]